MERFLLFVALGGAMAFGQAAVAGGALTGKVVDAATKAGIRKATVYAVGERSSGTQSGGLDFQSPPIFSAVTDGDGVFRFGGIAPGKYLLRAEKTAYLAPVGKLGVAVTAVAGEAREVGELQLARQAVIAGRVTDAEGEPVELANVQVVGASKRGMDAGAMTDDRGEFRIARLAAGTYRLLATKPVPSQTAPNTTTAGEQLQVNAPTFYPSALDEAASSSITVAGGEERTGVEIRLRRTAAVRVAGKVAGEVPANTPVYLSLQPAGSRRLSGASYWSAIAGSDGRFVFNNVTPGEYVAQGTLHRPGGTLPLSGSTRIRVGQQDVEDLTVALAPLARIVGRVRAESGGKLPVEQINVLLRPLEAGVPGGGGGRVKPDGTFVIDNVQRQRYAMVGVAPKGWYLKALTAAGQRQPELEFELTGAETVLELIYSNRPGTVSVTLDGATEESGKLVAVATPEGAVQLTNLYRIAPVAAGTQVVKIEDVPPGSYQIVVCSSLLVPALGEEAIWARVRGKAASAKLEEGGTVSASVRPIVESDLDEK